MDFQVILDAIKDYGAALISTISVGGVAGIAAIIYKVKEAIDSTKEKMNAVLVKTEKKESEFNDEKKALYSVIDEQNKKLQEITEELTKIKK